MKVSIVVPVYNEVSTVRIVIEKLRTLDLGYEKELIVVNDGSQDGTREALSEYESNGAREVRVHHNPVNLGKGASVRIGFSFATGDIFAIQDADLELDPAELKRLIDPIARGEVDVVYGSRFLDGGRQGTLSFYLANRTLATLTNLLYGSRLTDIETCYKVLRADVLRSLRLRASRFELEPELTAQILKRGYRLREIPIGYHPRSKAQGKKISWRDGVSAVSTLVRERFASRS